MQNIDAREMNVITIQSKIIEIYSLNYMTDAIVKFKNLHHKPRLCFSMRGYTFDFHSADKRSIMAVV